MQNFHSLVLNEIEQRQIGFIKICFYPVIGLDIPSHLIDFVSLKLLWFSTSQYNAR